MDENDRSKTVEMSMDDRNIVDVDMIWKTLGQMGRFQMKQLLVMLVSIWSCGFHVLSIVFIGKYFSTRLDEFGLSWSFLH